MLDCHGQQKGTSQKRRKMRWASAFPQHGQGKEQFDEDIPLRIHSLVVAMEVQEHRNIGNGHWAIENLLECHI